MGRRRDLFLLPVLPVLGLRAFGKMKLPNTLLDPSEAKVATADFGETRTYFDGPTGELACLTAGRLRLYAGKQPHPPHQHPEEEIMVIAEGNGQIFLDGKWQVAGPGAMMFCEANQLHGIINTGIAPMVFYFYKWKAGGAGRKS